MAELLRYPFAGETPRRTLGKGAVLSALGILIVPGILVAGYYGRVLARSAAGEETPPSFDGWRALFVQGLKTWLVVGMYFGVAVALVAFLTAASFVLGDLGTGAGAVVGALAIVVAALLILGVLFGPAWFFLPAVLTHVARNDRVLAAFEIATIRRVTCRREYLVPWVGGVVVLLVGSIAYGLLSWPGVIPNAGGGGWLDALTGVLGLGGHVVGAAVNFYCQVVAFHVFGRGYRAGAEAAGLDTADSDRTTEPDDRGWGAEARAWRERRREERERASE